jgi:argininosuccinate synthase
MRSSHACELYDHDLATYDDDDRFDHGAGEGFVKIWGLPVEIAARKAKAEKKAEPARVKQ